MKKEWLNKQLHGRSKTMPILSFPAVQLLNIKVEDLINSSDYQAKGMKRIADSCPTSASVTMMDLSVEAEAFGSKIHFSEMEVPTVIGTIINSEDDANRLEVPKVGTKRTGIYVEAVRKACKIITDRPVIAGVIGPFSLAGRLMGMTEIMVNCYIEPQMVDTVLEKVSNFILNYILAFKEAGANGVLIAEPAAGLLSPDLCAMFSSKYIKEIVSQVNDDQFIVIYHNCGNTIPLADSIIDIDADVYHFGNYIDLEEMIKLMPQDKIIMGNIDPVLLENGSKEQVAQEVHALLEKCSKYKNFIISSGCDIPPTSSWDNIFTYFETIKDFYKLNK